MGPILPNPVPRSLNRISLLSPICIDVLRRKVTAQAKRQRLRACLKVLPVSLLVDFKNYIDVFAMHARCENQSKLRIPDPPIPRRLGACAANQMA